MTFTLRNTSSYTLAQLNTGVLLKEDGFALLTESGDEILLENPRQDANYSTRNTQSLPVMPTRN